MTEYEFIFDGLDLTNKTILYAGVGSATSTDHWAKAVHERGGTSRIIGIDIHIPQEAEGRIETRLGKYYQYLERWPMGRMSTGGKRDG